jgi:Inositol polyphosphate kinase
MQIDSQRFDSSFGKSLTVESLASTLNVFFKSSDKALLLLEVDKILSLVSATKLTCYSCSLLVCYDSTHLVAKLIDFQHSTFGGSSTDEGLVIGLKSLMTMIS